APGQPAGTSASSRAPPSAAEPRSPAPAPLTDARTPAPTASAPRRPDPERPPPLTCSDLACLALPCSSTLPSSPQHSHIATTASLSSQAIPRHVRCAPFLLSGHLSLRTRA